MSADTILLYLPYALAAWLFLAGLYGVCTTRNYLHATGCLAVMQASTYVLLLAAGYRTGARAPSYQDVAYREPSVDSVVQSLALTDIVVGAAITALVLSLAITFAKRAGTLDPRTHEPLEG